MQRNCEHCGLTFDRAPGYLLGSIYFNYGLTALIIAVGYPLLHFAAGIPPRPLLIGGLAFCVLFPLWFFRYARSLWIGFDQFFDPSHSEGSSATDDNP
jgi:hypothetical protein